MMELIKGLAFGLVLSFMVGPVFFALIQTSIDKGFKAGVFMALGISLSDSLYIMLTFSGISKLTDNLELKFILGLGGALIMIIFGMNSIFKPVPVRGPNVNPMKSNSYLRKTAKGFVLNTLNPFVLIFWIGIAGLVTIQMDYNLEQASFFYIGVILMVLSMDITKSFLSHKLRMVVTPKFMKIMNRTVGIVLILFGIRLFYYALAIKNII
jgi:threonine/homoserine/homoserine lactone efflux protein